MKDYYENFNVIEPSEMRDYASPWGNSYLLITEEDIQALRSGKVLHHDDGEYGTFIELGSRCEDDI